MTNIISKDFRYATKNSKKKVWYYTIKCPKCGNKEEKRYHSKFVNLCGHCAKGGYTTEKFISISKTKHGDTYDYSLTNYINKRNDVVIICKIHGKFTQRASEHMEGHGCRKCGDIVRGNLCRLPEEEIRRRVAQHPNIELLGQDKENVYLKCEIHDRFTLKKYLINHKANLCTTCSFSYPQKQSIRPNLIGSKCKLYYVYLPDINMYKLGVTIQELDERLNGINYELIWEDVLEYPRAIDIEYTLNIKFLHFQYRGKEKLIKRGSYECYYKNILPQKPKSYNS